MDFRRRKLLLALGIQGVGMLLALAWHGWQGFVLGLGYPYNTFFAPPELRFSDLTIVINASKLPSPYLDAFQHYLPSAYFLFAGFGLLDLSLAKDIFVGVSVLGFVTILRIALRPIFVSTFWLYTCAVLLLVCSYPFLFSLDRGNVDMLTALFISVSLLFFRSRRFVPGLACLFPAISCKFYPLLLLALFVRPRHLRKIIIVASTLAGINVICLASFTASIDDSLMLLSRNLQFYTENYLIGNLGFSGSASMWNTTKALIVISYQWATDCFDPTQGPPVSWIECAFTFYKILALAWFIFITTYCIWIEKEFFRRAVLLLLFMTMAIPSGADYTLLFANVGLIVLILLPRRRRLDLWVIGMLAFALIPKREILLPFLGSSDTGFDISVGILLNPPCIITAMILLVRDGMRNKPWAHFRLRFFGLYDLLRRFTLSQVHTPSPAKAHARPSIRANRQPPFIN